MNNISPQSQVEQLPAPECEPHRFSSPLQRYNVNLTLSPASPLTEPTLLQETPVRLAQTPVSRPPQGRTVRLGPAGPRLALLPLGLRLLTVNLV